MKITVRLDEDLLARAKAHAARSGRSLTRLVEDALRALMVAEFGPPRRRQAPLPTYGKGGLRPGVNLDKSSELVDFQERPDGL